MTSSKDDVPTTTVKASDRRVSGRRVSGRRVSIAALVGTTIEYYDYGIFGYLAVVIGPLFFPSENEIVSILSTLLVFGVAFVVRPLGGIVLGRFGDRVGRKSVLLFTVLTMGVATGLIGLLPVHASIGVLAPVLLVLARMVQGFSAGGEIGGAATYVSECAPEGKRGLYGAATPMGAGLGFVLAAAIAGGATGLLTAEQLSSWGWRIPFLLAVPLAIICAVVRSGIEDSPEFADMVDKSEVSRSPLRDVFRTDTAGVLRVIVLAVAQTAGAYIGLTYMNVHMTKTLGVPALTSLFLLVAVTLASVALQPVAGHLSDRFGRKPLLLVGLIGYLILPFPAFQIMEEASVPSLLAGLCLLFIPYTFLQAVAYPSYAEFFSRRVRFTGVSIGFNIGALIGGGISPYLAAELVRSTGNSDAPAFIIIGATLLGFLGLVRAPETAHGALRG